MQSPTSGELLALSQGEIHHNPDPDSPLIPVLEEAARSLTPAIPLYEAWSEGGEKGLTAKYDELYPKQAIPSSTPETTTK